MVAGLWAQAVIVLSGVLSARLLGVEDRGRFALLMLFPAILPQLASMGLPLAVTYWVASGRASARAAARSIRLPALCQSAAVLLVHICILFLAVLPGEPRRMQVAGVASLTLPPIVLLQFYALALLQGQHRFRAFNILRSTPATLSTVGVVVVALLGRGDLGSIAVAYIAGSVLSCIVTIVFAQRGATGSRSDPRMPLKAPVGFGLRGVLGASSPLETFRLDQAIVGFLLSQAALGIYVAAIAFTNLPRFLAQSVGVIAYPRVAGEADDRVARLILWKFAALGTMIAAIVVIVLELNAGWMISFIFGSAFAGAVTPARILLLSSFFFSVRRLLSDGARGIGRPGSGTVAEFISWAVLVPCLFAFAPIWGVNGVAVGLTASAAVAAGYLVFDLAWRSGRGSRKAG